MANTKYTRAICEAIWSKGGRIKSYRTNKHLVFHTTLSPKPLVFAGSPGKSSGKQTQVIEKHINRHIKYNQGGA